MRCCALTSRMVHRQVALVLAVLGIITLCMGQDVGCPDKVTVEVANDVVIPCNISGAPEYIFWFRGSFIPHTNDVPILSSRLGELGGSEYGKGKFALTEKGALIINDTRVEDENLYTLMVISSDGRDLQTSSNMSIFIKPRTECPVIGGCEACKPCNRTVGHEVELTCVISDARPRIELEWRVLSGDVITSSESLPIAHPDDSVTWNTSVSIKYNLGGCGARAVLRCKAANSLYLLSSSEAEIDIHTDPCTATPKITFAPNTTPALGESNLLEVIFIVETFLIIFMIIITITVVVHRRKRHEGLKELLVDLMDMTKTSAADNRKILIRCLLKSYMDITHAKPSETSDNKRRECKCTIESDDGKSVVRDIDDIFTADFREQHSRVLIVARKGYGRRTTTNRLLSDWCRCDDRDYLLLYIPMRQVEPGNSVCDVLKKLYARKSNLTVDDIENLCKENKCLILLGCLEKFGNLQEICSTETQEVSKLSFEGLINDSIHVVKDQVTVWATSRDVDDVNPCFAKPHTKVTITGAPKMTGGR